MKFKTGLVTEARMRVQDKENQERLHMKHEGVPADVKIVEKSTALQTALNFVLTMIRIAAMIALATLAIIGLLAIIFPDPRTEILKVIMDIYEQIIGFFR